MQYNLANTLLLSLTVEKGGASLLNEMASSKVVDRASQLACLKAVVGDTMPELIWNMNDQNDQGNEDDELLNFVTTEIWNADVLQSLPLEQTEEMTSKQRRTVLQNTSSRLALAVSHNLVTLGCAKDDGESLAVCTDVIKGWWKQVQRPEEEQEQAAGRGEVEDEADDDEEGSGVPPGHCAMCVRYMPLTFHHLCPRMVQKGMLKKGMYTKQNVNNGIDICRPCHSAIHKAFDHETMALQVNTLEKILDDERVQRWIRYAEKQRTVSKDHAIRGLRYRR